MNESEKSIIKVKKNAKSQEKNNQKNYETTKIKKTSLPLRTKKKLFYCFHVQVS